MKQIIRMGWPTFSQYDYLTFVFKYMDLGSCLWKWWDLCLLSLLDLRKFLNVFFILKNKYQGLCYKEKVKMQANRDCLTYDNLQNLALCYSNSSHVASIIQWNVFVSFIFFSFLFISFFSSNFRSSKPSILSVAFTVCFIQNFITDSWALLNLGKENKLLISSFGFPRAKVRHVLSA